MARIARFVVPGLPHHVTQRGNRRLFRHYLYVVIPLSTCISNSLTRTTYPRLYIM